MHIKTYYLLSSEWRKNCAGMNEIENTKQVRNLPKFQIYPRGPRQRLLKFVKNIWFVFDKIHVYMPFHGLSKGRWL